MYLKTTCFTFFIPRLVGSNIDIDINVNINIPFGISLQHNFFPPM